MRCVSRLWLSSTALLALLCGTGFLASLCGILPLALALWNYSPSVSPLAFLVASWPSFV
jgi:hypothetical protein